MAKRLIPAEYYRMYGARNLFWVPLASYWRMLYMLTHYEGEETRRALVLDILSHPQYDKVMGYRSR